MTFQPLLLLLLFGHVIGDFYFQTDNMAKGKCATDKRERWKWLACHGVGYALAMAVVLFPVVRFSWGLLVAFLVVSVSHFVLDVFKRFIPKKPFIFDQIMHVVIIFLVWFIWHDEMAVWPYINWLNGMVFPRLTALHENPYWMLLGVLLILRPVGRLIKSNEIWDFGEAKGAESGSDKKHSGRMIGYLERLIIFFLMLNNAVATIGFVIAAKSVIRFPEIISEADKTEKRSRVEYYLIGTLLSMACTFVVYVLLRLASVST